MRARRDGKVWFSAAALLLAGCSAITLPPTESLPQRALRLLWRRSVVDELLVPFTAVERCTPAVDPAGDRIFVGSSDEYLYALRGSDGSSLWRLRTRGAVGSEVAYDPESKTVLFGTDDGFFYSVDADRGRVEWRTAAHGVVRRGPAMTREAVYVAAGGDTVLALDRSSGHRLWQYRRQPPEGFVVEGYSGVVLHGRRVYAGFSDGYVVALDASEGTPLWERDTSADLELPAEDTSVPQYLDVDTTPVVRAGVVYAASFAAGLYALDERGGGVRWRREELSGITGLAMAGDELVATSGQLGVIGVSPTDGSTLFRVRLPAAWLTSPVVSRHLILVGAARGELYAISRESREVLTMIDPGNGFFANPIARGGRAFALSNGGVVYSFELL